MSLATAQSPFEMPGDRVFDDNLLNDDAVWQKTCNVCSLYLCLCLYLIDLTYLILAYGILQ